MIPKSVLFYWSKGAGTRRRILLIIKNANEKNEPCFLNVMAKRLKLTHVAVKKHIDLLVEEGYVEPINPSGKPVYLRLSDSGKGIIKELGKKSN
ncbi:MAG: hypothetical protein V1645_04570 [archaeon]